jgi:starch-binding outer membrane protein, SusD/RagB family
MKKIYYFLLIPLLFLFATESCDNYLDEENYTNAGYDYLTTSAGVETAVNGVYYTMRWYANQENYMVLTDMGNDLAWDGSDGANKAAFNQYATMNSTISAYSIVDLFWSNAYNGINRANTAMMFIPTATGMSDATKTQRMAECRFMRAYFYFDLVQHFGAVPLVTKGNISEIITSFKRDSVYDVYKQIISDLRAAYDVLPDVWQQTNRGRATKWAAGHLLAKVYLTRISADVATRGGKTTDLDSAAYYAVQVINSGKFALESNYTNVFLQSNEKVSKEVIWDVQFISGNDLYNERSTNGTNGGNQLHQYWVMEYQVKPGMIWDVENDSPFKRLRPNPMMIAKLWDGANDARLFKSFKWVYYSNNSATLPKWVANYYYLNPVTNVEDKTQIIYSPAAALVGTYKFKLADTAIYTSPQYYGALPYYSTFKTTQNVLDATKYSTMLTDIAKKPYLFVPLDRNDRKASRHFLNILTISVRMLTTGLVLETLSECV